MDPSFRLRFELVAACEVLEEGAAALNPRRAEFVVVWFNPEPEHSPAPHRHYKSASSPVVMDSAAEDGLPTPTPGPTAGLYSPSAVDTMMLVSMTSSIVLRSGIGIVCARRLWDYRSKGLFRCGEVKSSFHAAMLGTLLFSLPYFTFCEAR